MIRYILAVALLMACTMQATAQKDLHRQMDSLLHSGANAFNGVILVVQNGKTLYKTSNGYSNLEGKTPVNEDDQFIIGSISKQITAVLVLREYEKGHLRLDAPLSRYLPYLNYSGADSITIHQLLTHTSGLREDLKPPLVFAPGSRFEYSNAGYGLLGDVVAKVSGKTFATMAENLFKECKMHNSLHPLANKHKRLVHGYAEDTTGKINLIPSEGRIPMNWVPSGGFVSTAQDLIKWNTCLHNGKLLADSTYRLMTTPQPNAVREHPLFGLTAYGYGITIDNDDGLLQLGQTGKLPGYNSIDFYFPASGTSMVVLNNIQYGPREIKPGYYYHKGVQDIVRSFLLSNKTR